MEYYEKHVEESKEFVCSRNHNHSYPAHFHSNIEIFISKKSNYDITINKQHYNVSNGQIAIIDSYAVHSYEKLCNDNTDDFVIVIPNDYSIAYNNKNIITPIITNINLCEKLCYLFDNFFINKPLDEQIPTVELMLALLSKHIKWQDKKNEDETALIRKILNYIQNNFQNHISRASIAHELGYVEAHISRVFHQYVGKGIKEYINDLRLNYVNKLRIYHPKEKIINLIYKAGFTSQQTYYRCLSHKKDSKI